MITAMNIVNALQNKGINATYQEVKKNNVTFKGVTIKEANSNIAPCIYLDEIVKKANADNAGIQAVVNYVLSIYEENRQKDIDTSYIMSRDYILEHINVGMQRASNEDYIKRSDLAGVDTYLYITVEVNGNSGTIKLKKEHLDMAGVDTQEAWDTAFKHLHDDIKVQNMGNFLGIPMDIDMIVLTNNHNYYGASAVLDRRTIEDLADRYNFDTYYILPASRHEVILLPDFEGANIDMLTSFVIDVNRMTVDPIDQLSDTAYKMAV